MTGAIYRTPWFLRLARETRGAGWTLHAAALSLAAEAGATALPPELAELALACLPQRLRALAVRALLAVGLWVREPSGGYLLREAPPSSWEPPAEVTNGAPSPEAMRQRRRRERLRGVTSDGVTPPCHGVTSSVTSGVSPPVTGRDIERDSGVFSEESPTSPGVTSSVTPSALPSRPPTHAGENSPLSSLLSENFEKEEREGEREISPPPPSVTASVTPEALALLRSVLPPGTLDQPPSPPSPSVDPIEGGEAVAVALWSEATGRQASELGARDRSAIRVRVQERVGVAAFRAAFAHAAATPWFLEEPDRLLPRVICGKPWEECVRKGRARLPSSSTAPSSRRSVEAAPPSEPRPRPEPPETLPYGDRYSHPTRIRDHLGARYYPLPEERIYLRADLYLARRGSGREAAE